MSAYDLILRGGTLVTADGPSEADLAVADGKIADVSPRLGGAAREEVDASGLHVEPLGEEWPQFRHPRRPEFILTQPHLHGTSGFFIARLLT